MPWNFLFQCTICFNVLNLPDVHDERGKFQLCDLTLGPLDVGGDQPIQLDFKKISLKWQISV